MLEAISKRRSIRHYENRPVEEEKIQEILAAAMSSPSAMNQRPWEFYVIRDPELLKKLGEVTPYSKPIGEAPVGIAMMVRRDSLCPAYQDIDCGIASENLMLEAASQGLGFNTIRRIRPSSCSRRSTRTTTGMRGRLNSCLR